MILEKIADNFLFILIVILLVNIFQRKYVPKSNNKRKATLFIAVLFFIWQLTIVVILQQGWPHYLAIVTLLIPIAIAYAFQDRIFIFKTKCVSCNAKLPFEVTLYFDDNLCYDCRPKEYKNPVEATDVEQIDWENWPITDDAVLCYIVDYEKKEVLLINKKRGFGKGNVSAPGGHIEEGETPMEAAIREVKEEVNLEVDDLEYRGLLQFQFDDGMAMKGQVFFTSTYSGELKESDEAKPFWCPLEDLPYDRMWEDDILWLPMALEGKVFEGRFIFKDNKMVSHLVFEVQ